jgi:hypothetical protein
LLQRITRGYISIVAAYNKRLNIHCCSLKQETTYPFLQLLSRGYMSTVTPITKGYMYIHWKRVHLHCWNYSQKATSPLFRQVRRGGISITVFQLIKRRLRLHRYNQFQETQVQPVQPITRGYVFTVPINHKGLHLQYSTLLRPITKGTSWRHKSKVVTNTKLLFLNDWAEEKYPYAESKYEFKK